MATPLERRIYSVGEARRLARRSLPHALFDFVDGGAEDEVTLRRNEAAFAAVELLPKPLSGSTARDQRLTLFGREIAMPLIVGPTGLSGLLWPDGELATARASAAAGIPYCLSHGSTCTIEALAEAGAAPRWMQVFMFRDRGLTRSFTERAQAAGYDALVLTTDNQALGNRERDLRNGFSIPPRLTARTMLGMAARPGWLWRMRDRRDLTFANYTDAGGDLRAIASRMASLLDPGAAWADVAWLRGIWHGPLAAQGRAPSRRGAARDRRRDRRHRRQQPWRPSARRRPGHHRRAARHRRCRGGAHPGPGRRRRPPRRRHRPRPLARRHRLLDRTPASMGSRGRRRGRGCRGVGPLPPRARPGHGLVRLGCGVGDRRGRAASTQA